MVADSSTETLSDSGAARPPGNSPRRVLLAAALNSLDSHICTQLPHTESRNGWTLIQRPFPWDANRALSEPAQLDGCLAWATHEREIECVRAMQIPTVNMSNGLELPTLPTVTNDNREIGRIAAKHLLHDCAMPNLALILVSPDRYAWSRLRGDGFREMAGEAGLSCSELHRPVRAGAQTAQPDEELERWLARLAKPVGIMAVDDWSATAVVRACRRLGIVIPHDVAVIGANNDLICSMTTPSVTSVDRNQALVVLEAAKLLERLMNGEAAPAQPLYVPPLGVIKRDSTNTLAVGDPTIAAIVEYVRANIEEPFNIKTLAKRFDVSSRTIARGFARWMHCRPAEYVLRVRLARARALLREPHKLSVIARVSGFSDEKQFRIVFKRSTGLSPQEYRRQLMANSCITR